MADFSVVRKPRAANAAEKRLIDRDLFKAFLAKAALFFADDFLAVEAGRGKQSIGEPIFQLREVKHFLV